jgi:hypothetical protein
MEKANSQSIPESFITPICTHPPKPALYLSKPVLYRPFAFPTPRIYLILNYKIGYAGYKGKFILWLSLSFFPPITPNFCESLRKAVILFAVS